MNKAYDALLRSSRVSTVTREALDVRSGRDDPHYTPAAMDPTSLDLLRAVIERVIPQPTSLTIDLAARIDRQLAEGIGDGWRFATLPPDRAAYRIGLHTLDRWASRQWGKSFGSLEPAAQDRLLALAAVGGNDVENGDSHPGEFNAEQMRAWFEDVRAEAVQLFAGTPDVLARIGYSGIANGGDGTPKSGFVRVGLDEREEWEPLSSLETP